MVRVSVSSIIKAPKERVWALIADVENWPRWAPSDARNRVISHPVVSREGNVVVCDEFEQAWLIKAKHRDRYTLYPEERIDEEIIQGDFTGGISLTLKSVPEGTLAHVDADVSPRNFFLRFLSTLLGGEKLLTQFWIDLFKQLASVAENGCSPGEPMYCPSTMLEGLFEKPSLSIGILVNSGKRQIDVENRTIYNDTHWKGFYPPDSPVPAWIFQNSFNKTFKIENGTLKGVTSTFDDSIKGENKLRLIDPNDPGKGILLEYTEPQFALFYDILKVISEDIIIGKAYAGRYPDGKTILIFTMARKYGFDFMSPEDHEELFVKYGKPPDINKIRGEWEGRIVSNASLPPPFFRFRYDIDISGKVICKWNFMNILKGDSKIELTPEQMLMFDFTNFHDEIRMIADDLMVGKYCPEAKEILNIIGERSSGLIHFEKTQGGVRPCIYYYIKKEKGAP